MVGRGQGGGARHGRKGTVVGHFITLGSLGRGQGSGNIMVGRGLNYSFTSFWTCVCVCVRVCVCVCVQLAAIIKPNDGECHMKPIEGETHRFEYTDGLVQDYPSLYQIRQALLANLIVPVFALAVFNLTDLKLQNNLVSSCS